MKWKNFLLTVLCTLLTFTLPENTVYSEGLRDQLEGLVYEVEEWSSPQAWNLNKASSDQWQIWTKEEDVVRKRSNGASVTTPVLPQDADRKSPEEGAPPLHTKITGIPNGFYQVFSSPSNRPLAISLDGKNWEKTGRGENDLGFFQIDDGTFELWVDDLYASPQSRGWAYYDYVRLVPAAKDDIPKLSHLETFTLPDGSTQLSWISNTPTMPAVVEIDGKKWIEQESGMRNHRVVLSGLEKGKKVRASVTLPLNRKGWGTSETVEFEAGASPVPGETQKMSVILTVAEPTDHPRTDWPVISGVPFAKGVLANAENVRLLDESGVLVPAQFETFAKWEDGSVKWLICTFRASTRAKSANAVTYRLETSPEFCFSAGTSPVSEAEMRKFAASLSSCVRFADGTQTQTGAGEFTLVSQGTQAAVLQSSGEFQPKEGEKDFLTGHEITFFGEDFIRIRSTLANRELEEPMTLVKSASVFVPGGKGVSGISWLQDTEKHAVCELTASTAGSASAAETADAANAADTRKEVEHWDGMISADDGAFFLRDAWQCWPKGMTCRDGKVGFHILPELPENYAPDGAKTLDGLLMHYYWLKDSAYLFKRGMELRHDFWIVRPDPKTGKVREVKSAWLQNPLFAAAPAEYYCAAGVFPPVDPVRKGKWDAYEEAFRTSFANLEKGRQQRGEYGWMNFGDWFGERKFNWGNQEYDLAYVCALFFARTADPAILTRGIETARHYTTVDRKAYPWKPEERELRYTHCLGHVNGFFVKGDPRIQDIMGVYQYSLLGWESDNSGGHTFHPGTWYIACLTGDRYLWDAAYSCAWRQAERYTPKYDFRIERSAGWSMNNAVYSYRFTGNPFFMNAARLYLECIESKQNPETGCFDLPQDQTECDCPDKKEHRGGKAFAVGVLLHSLVRFSESVPDTESRETSQKIIVRAANWLLDESWNEAKMGFRYKTGCPKFADSGWYSILVTEGIAKAGEITGDPRYPEFLLRTLPEPLKAVSGTGRSCGKDFSQKHRQTAHTLWYLDRYLEKKANGTQNTN